MADVRVEVGGSPSPDEVAAIIAAVEMVWPQPAAVIEAPVNDNRWRHADRWWAEGRLPNRWR